MGIVRDGERKSVEPIAPRAGCHPERVWRSARVHGFAGKVTNCQTAVNLSVAMRESHAPIDVALYMPQC
jgi:hypothetical protein